MDVVLLSRIQFALTSGFHYIYPPLSIGLGLFLIIVEGLYVKTRKPLYKEMAKFWIKVFALTFALGVATGVVQVFGFGTNWARYSRFVGDVFGGALAAEGIFAFFLEAGFLGVMVFGWNRVSPKIHYMATILVSLGAHFSALWIVSANSWMQTPAGHKIVGTGEQTRAIVANFWKMIFTPSNLDRIAHVLLGCWLAGIFLVISISAYYMLKKNHLAFARSSMKISLFLAFATLLLQLASGDSTAKGVATHQPSKLAAMEGIFETTEKTPAWLFGWIDKKQQLVKGIQIPGLLSFLIYGNFRTPIKGLDQIPLDEQPPLQPVFQAYHAMVWMWVFMFLCSGIALYRLWRKKLESSKGLLRLLVLSVIFPQIANQVGWMTAEIGRQPWAVYGLLRTIHATSPTIKSAHVIGSLLMFTVVYLFLLALFLFLLDRKIKQGPQENAAEDAEVYQDPYKKRRQ
jgi:cytochrome bd ubiquinol oxidase subunit I